MAEKVWDCCPKCKSKLTNKVECRTCGVIFEKYFQAEARKKAQAEKDAEGKEKSKKRSMIVLAGLILAGCLVTAFSFLGRVSSPPALPPAPGSLPSGGNTITREEPSQQSPVVQRPQTGESMGKGGGDTGDKRFIQDASNATVTVQTPWGVFGSGFFINENSVVTNKHVVEFNNESYDEFRKRVGQGKKDLALEVEAIQELKRRLERMPDGPNRMQVANLIQQKEAGLNSYQTKLQEAERKLAELEQKKSSQDIRIILADGSEHSVSNVIMSDTHDLALLKVYSAKTPILKRSRDGHPLEQGDTVYTIGSPRGFRNTVTSGIFSGYRKMKDKDDIYLQVDAPINPGNSGGPLIDGHGNVYGINTMIVTNSEGLGFAIPIETVFEDFRNSL
ncbi:MAG: trypsin-like peptidase domain-containing protein [Desulfocapsaceae bacterium]|nr:trypsin-like peptidase domain-containing protein [Desulfocapsaceae bacterium]